MDFIKELKYYDSITGMAEIVRRYFVMNGFDGALTAFGFLVGFFITGTTDPGLIISVGVSTAIAIGFSGFTAAAMSERAERTQDVKEMEKDMHKDLDDTDLKKAYDFATLSTAIVNGLAPISTALFLLLPFVFFPLPTAYYVSFALSLLTFFVLGMFLGKIAKENIILMGFQFVFAGILCMAIIFLIDPSTG